LFGLFASGFCVADAGIERKLRRADGIAAGVAPRQCGRLEEDCVAFLQEGNGFAASLPKPQLGSGVSQVRLLLDPAQSVEVLNVRTPLVLDPIPDMAEYEIGEEDRTQGKNHEEEKQIGDVTDRSYGYWERGDGPLKTLRRYRGKEEKDQDTQGERDWDRDEPKHPFLFAAIRISRALRWRREAFQEGSPKICLLYKDKDRDKWERCGYQNRSHPCHIRNHGGGDDRAQAEHKDGETGPDKFSGQYFAVPFHELGELHWCEAKALSDKRIRVDDDAVVGQPRDI
jgi:hypothetical protein